MNSNVEKALISTALVLASAAPVLAQKEIPKAKGHDQCPLGYVNTLGNPLRFAYLLRGSPNKRRSLQGRVDEHRLGLLPEEEGSLGHSLIKHRLHLRHDRHQGAAVDRTSLSDTLSRLLPCRTRSNNHDCCLLVVRCCAGECRKLGLV